MTITSSNPSWYHPRGTKHFDMPVSLGKAKEIVDPQNVKHHSFLPFMRREKRSRKSRAKNGSPKWKVRSIMYASHQDSHIFSYYDYELQKIYEARIQPFSDSILAFRKLGRNNIHFAKEAFEYIEQQPEGIAIVVDVEGFFDNLQHDILKKQWQSLLDLPSLPEDHYKVFKAITRYSFVDQTQAYSHRELTGINGLCSVQKMRSIIASGHLNIDYNRNSFGIPQGSPISGLLANLYMIDFDKRLADKAKKKNARYWRYCDDILIVCDSRDRAYFRRLIKDSLNTIGLKINPSKTRIAKFSHVNGVLEFDRALQYLGFEFDGKRTLIRSQTLSKHKIKTIRCIKRELAYAKWRGLTKIRRKKIYSSYSHLLNKMVRSATDKRKHRNFRTYVSSAAKILNSPAILQQMRKHWTWLGERIKKANDELR